MRTPPNSLIVIVTSSSRYIPIYPYHLRAVCYFFKIPFSDHMGDVPLASHLRLSLVRLSTPATVSTAGSWRWGPRTFQVKWSLHIWHIFPVSTISVRENWDCRRVSSVETPKNLSCVDHFCLVSCLMGTFITHGDHGFCLASRLEGV